MIWRGRGRGSSKSVKKIETTGESTHGWKRGEFNPSFSILETLAVAAVVPGGTKGRQKRWIHNERTLSEEEVIKNRLQTCYLHSKSQQQAKHQCGLPAWHSAVGRGKKSCQLDRLSSLGRVLNRIATRLTVMVNSNSKNLLGRSLLVLHFLHLVT